jgi:uncharacterized protein
MTQETVARVFENVLCGPFCGDRLTVVWHAGEPLVPGIDFYEQAFATINFLNSERVAITQSFQTNGTLINNAWVDFFFRHNVSLGVSIDGPKWLHDTNRRDRRGAGTFERTMAAIRLLQQNRFPFHAIAVLTNASLGAADEILEFFVENGIVDVGFNIEEREGVNTSSSLQSAAESVVRSFFEEMAAFCTRHPGVLRIRELSGATTAILDRQSSAYGNPQTEAVRIVTVGVDGSLSTFSPELIGAQSPAYGDFKFGSVYSGGIAGMLSDPFFKKAERDIARGVECCRSGCDYFEVCLGGAPANKYFENGDLASTETMYCRFSKKTVVDVILAALEQGYGRSTI